MFKLSLKNCEMSFGDDVFFSYYNKATGYVSCVALPFRIIYEEVPCQRRKELNEYVYKILDIVEISGGVRLRLEVCNYFRIDCQFNVSADGFSFKLFPESLIETAPNMYRLLELELLPGFLNACHGEGGYFLLPNFCGALMRFNVEQEVELRDMVYGDQTEYEHYVTMPVCGMTHSKGSWLCILTEGRHDSRIVTRSEKVKDSYSYSLAPCFIFRHCKEDPVSGRSMEVQFISLPANADYNAMAVRYRGYLLSERHMIPLRERLPDNEVLAYTAESYHCKIFHGMKLNRLYDGIEEMTVSTTFAEAEDIARGMSADGIDKCTFFLVGWNPEGHDGKWPTRFPVEKRLGGIEGFKKLKATLDELGYRLSVHDNHVDAYRSSEYFPYLDIVTDRSGEPVGGSQWGGGATYRVCPATMPTPKSLLDLERFKELGINGIYYMDNMPSPIFTCHHPKHPADRKGWADGISRMAQSARDRFGCIAVEGYQDYVLQNVDMPWKVHAPFRKLAPYFDSVPLIEELVPFFQVSYHGLKLYHTEYAWAYPKVGFDCKQAAALELALGALPMNEVQERAEWHLPSWHDWRGQMAQHYQTLCTEYADRQSVFIDSISLDREKNVMETIYADGVKITCDLNNGNIKKGDIQQ
jgi:hypothetical protein